MMFTIGRKMDELEKVAMALFDLACGENRFARLQESQKELDSIRMENQKLRDSSDALEREIVALDAQRSELSKLIDASFPPEAKKVVEAKFYEKFNQAFKRVQERVEKQVIDAREMEVKVAVALAAAQQIELEEIKAMRGN